MTNQTQFENALDFAAKQCRRLIERYPGYVPMYTVGGEWKQEGERWTHWCEGFYPGIFWLLHKHTREIFWREQAEKYTRPLEPRRFDRNVHDLGFLFFSTYLRWYRLTGDESLRQILIDAGCTLALRRQMGGYLASFIGPESLFIDIMMNVGLILWAANATGNDALKQIALEHCRTTQQYLVRDDGGTAHEGIFDVTTGRFLRQATHQGYKPESTWTRGLAWALYGFTAVARLSGETSFLETARKCADCYLRRCPLSLVPPWDFDAPAEESQSLDSSAAAIAASGLFDLSEAVDLWAEKDRYRRAALTILTSLCMDEFMPLQRPEWEGILLHGVYHIHKGLGVDESVSWGDHFFVEALVKALAGKSAAAW
ncbi:MAG: glycoside hydrolase family 88 protein [Gemmataceae bacterium]|nr:glycoside hydrolase family 88 protein [Gemmataceae bacterium]